jgi:two-component sensor histidine kinase
MSAAPAVSHLHALPLLEWLAAEMDPAHRRVVVQCEPDLELSAEQAAPLLGAAREAISNALRHAYPLGSDGKVWVKLHGQGRLTLSVRDMGRGLPTLDGKLHPGLDSIHAFADDLGGYARIDNRNYGGAEVSVVFPQR